MPGFDVRLAMRGDGPRPEVVGQPFVHVPDARWMVDVLEGGMNSGAASVAVMIPLPSGVLVVAETSLKLWSSVVIAARARWPEQFADGPLALPASGSGGLVDDGSFVFQRLDDGSLTLESAVQQAFAAATVYVAMQQAATGETVFETDPLDAIAAALVTLINEEF